MANFEKPFDFQDDGLTGARGLPSWGAVKAAALLALLLAYGLGFVILYPLAQASAARSAAEGNDPMAFIGP